LELNYWFEASALTQEPFLAINLSNRTPNSLSQNASLFAKQQAGYWEIPKLALSAGLEGKLVVLFNMRPGQGAVIYTGRIASVVVAGITAHPVPRNRYLLTVKAPWKIEGTSHVTFSEFLTGFRLSSNPTCAWGDGSNYAPPDIEESIDDGSGKIGSNYMAWVAQRANHDVFAKRVRAVWGSTCALTGLRAPRLLQACHLVPWNEANEQEKINPHNGLLLCVHLHALLDSHLISFDDDGRLMLAKGLDRGIKKLILASGNIGLRKRPTNEQIGFLRQHRAEAAKHHSLVRAV
jgi:hypothetical protein